MHRISIYVITFAILFVIANTLTTFAQANKVKIAIVKPTFTAAAYNHAFYGFYDTYDNKVLYTKSAAKNVTTNLNLLTGKIPNYTKSYGYEVLHDYPYIQQLFPRDNVANLTDGDVDEGKIFGPSSPANRYDILILGHQEYVTQQEYDNLKKFVANGGTLVLLDSNVFFAQVRYDKEAQTVTLVKGHGWGFNGRTAFPSVFERWANETSNWIGSNYYYWGGNNADIKFTNNPFNYTHFEEQYTTNPNVKVLLNYGAVYPDHTHMTYAIYPDWVQKTYPTPITEAYELNYLKGKVISLSIYSDHIQYNNNFIKFLDKLMLHYAV